MHTLAAHNLVIVEVILRNRADFFAEIREQVNLGSKITTMFTASLLFLAIYGGVMGAAHSPLQAVSSAFKLPVLFLLTFAITTPSLHFFNILFGAQQTLFQTMALILTAITTTSVLLVSLAPVTLFFLMTSSEYAFFKLLNVVFFAMAGAMGILFLREGAQLIMAGTDTGKRARRLIFILWACLYGFVGSQMAWTLAPFVGEPGHEFVLTRQIGGNFYSDVIQSLQELVLP